MRLFLDANVLFSASNPESVFFRLIKLAIEQADAVMTSDLAREEARRNLTLKRSIWLPTFEALVTHPRAGEGKGIQIHPSALFELPVQLADKDAPLFCAAIAARADYFVTGDRRDFAHLFDREIRGVTTITPKQLAEKLVELNEGGEASS
ncbi:MAG: DNA-binding protein [bacterium]|nr:DNA-binding protein [bacterium]